jgi:predicted Zn-ribbon and HTH transcriptional regulator
MKCPLSKEIDVGVDCKFNFCWYWHNKAKKNCVIVDTGNDHLLATDIMRIYKQNDENDAEKIIALGREKIKQWLKLLENLETVEPKGCVNCGYINCKNKAACNERQCKEIRITLPLEDVLKMHPARWYAALKLIEKNPILQSIKARKLNHA